MERDQVLFVLTVLRRIEADFDDPKFRRLSSSAGVVQQARSELESAGFRTSEDGKWLMFDSKDREALRSQIEALQAKVGVNGSAVTTSLDYKVNKPLNSSVLAAIIIMDIGV